MARRLRWRRSPWPSYRVSGPLAPDPGPADGPTSWAAGYTKDGVTFRAEVLGERLLGAAIGDPGQGTVSFEFEVGEAGLRFSPTCHGPAGS